MRHILALFCLCTSCGMLSTGCISALDPKTEQPEYASQMDPQAMWHAIMDLASDEKLEAEAAEKRIRATGDAGMRALIQYSRMLGDEAALHAMGQAVRCEHFSTISAFTAPGNSPADMAAKALARWLAEDPKLALKLAASKVTFEQQAALLSQVQSATAYRDLLAALDKAKGHNGALVMSSMRTLACVQMNDPAGLAKLQEAVGESLLALHNKVKPPQWSKRCVNPDEDVPGLEEAMLKEDWFSSGWGVNGNELSIPVKQTKGALRVKLAPECAWTLYERLASKGKHMICLLESTISASHVPPTLRAKIAQRLADDLEHAEVSRQNKLLALAINAGATSKRRVQLPKHLINAEGLLEAAARQGQPKIKSMIERHLLCRGSLVHCEACRLLGLLDDEDASQQAWLMGRDCPGALGDATIALIWAEDPRACELLNRLMASNHFLPNGIEQALVEKDSPELRACLRDAAKKRRGKARQLLKILGWIQKTESE